jgi:L-amino acid N-acyltransferase YncA
MRLGNWALGVESWELIRVSSYRFCRTDDIGLLAESLNRCWAPYFPGEPLMTPAAFKRTIRDLRVWCSSCMVAFAGPDPIAVLIGAKRESCTLVHRIAVHPDHRRQGHARHLLDSLASKLAILGPPRIVAEVPETFGAACGLFSAGGYVEEASLTDYVMSLDDNDAAHDTTGGLVIPITVDDLEANGLLGDDKSPQCWERSIEVLQARKDEIAGIAVASDERIEACVLHSPAVLTGATDVVLLRSFVEDGGKRLAHLLARLRAQGMRSLRLSKVHSSEISRACLESLGFRPDGEHRLYTTRAGA